MKRESPVGSASETKAILVVALNLIAKYRQCKEDQYLLGGMNVLSAYHHALETGHRVPLRIRQMIEVIEADSVPLQ